MLTSDNTPTNFHIQHTTQLGPSWEYNNQIIYFKKK